MPEKQDCRARRERGGALSIKKGSSLSLIAAQQSLHHDRSLPSTPSTAQHMYKLKESIA